MANYGLVKTMKAAAIGTILPWTGDLSSVPSGWIICDGSTINAADYPLLAQTIGTYYGGSPTFNLSDFPWNTPATAVQQFSLPNLGQKPLSDTSASYFSGPSAIGGPIDTSGASAVVASFMGSDQDNGVTNRVSDANADILFNYTPENDFTGTISGQTLDPGFGTDTVYTGGRKLGRRHIPTHSHDTSFPTIAGKQQSRPGSGVSCSRTISYNIQKAPDDEFAGFPPDVDGRLSAPVANWSGARQISGNALGSGTSGVILGNINSEQPGPNLKPQSAVSHGISNWIGNGQVVAQPFGEPNTEGHSRLFEPGGAAGQQDLEMPYAIGGTGNVTVPNRNFDDGSGTSGDDHRPYKVFFNHSGIDFTRNTSTPGITDSISAHDHSTFQVSFDRTASSLRMPALISLNDVVSNVVPGNLPDALNITVTLPTPKVVVLYIIRAY